MTEFARLDIRVDSSSAKTATGELDRLGRQAKTTERAFADLVKTAAAGVLGTVGVAAIAREADAYANLSARIKLVTSSEEQFNAVRRQVIAISMRTGGELSATTDLYTKMARSVKGAQATQANFLAVTETINKSLAVSGTTGQAAEGVIRQLGQGLASGTLRGDEFNSVMEGAPILMEAVAKSMGTTTGALRQLAADGKLTSDVLVKALLKAGKDIDAQFAQMPLTISRATSELKTAFTVYIGSSDEAAGSSKALAGSISLLANNLDTIADAAVAVAVVFGGRYAAAKAMALRETVLKTAALAAEAQAELRSARAAEVAAAAELARARSLSLMGGGLASVTAAETAHAAAVARTAEASAAAATRTGVLAAAGRGLLGVVGGPVGLAITMAAVAASFIDFGNSAEQMPQAVDKGTSSLSRMDFVAQRLAKNLKAATDNISNLSSAQISAEITKTEAAIAKLEQRLNTDRKRTPRSAGYYQELQAQIDSRKQELQALQSALGVVSGKEQKDASKGADFERISLENKQVEAEKTGNIAKQVAAREALIRKQYASELAQAQGNADNIKAVETRIAQEVAAFKKTLTEKAADDAKEAKEKQIKAESDLNNLVWAMADEKAKSDRELEDTRLDIAISGARARGNVLEAEQLEIVRKFNALKTKMLADGGTDADVGAIEELMGFESAKAKMDDFERRLKALQEAADRLKEKAKLDFESGNINSTQYKARVAGADAGLKAGAQGLVDEATAGGLTPSRALTDQVDALDKGREKAGLFRKELEGIGLDADLVADKFAAGLTNAIMDFVNGTKTAKEAFRAFAASFLADIAQMILKKMILNALGYGFSGGGLVAGYSSGGYTGDGGKYQPAGVVHRGEYVIPKHIVQQPGSLEFLRQYHAVGMKALPAFPGYADGGLVSNPGPMMANAVDNAAAMSATLNNSQNFYLVDDPGRIADVLSSQKGRDAMVVAISREPSKFKSILKV